jgi:2TM domain-containing protein
MTSGRTIDVDELRAVALDRIRRRRNFVAHVFAYLIGGLTLVIVWATTEYRNAGGWPTGFRAGRENHDWDPWIMYPLIAGALALGVHAWIAFGRRPASEREIEQEIERLRSRRLSA